MFGPQELDSKNTYNPDLQNIEESAERTYGEANSFFRKEELYIKDIENRIRNGELTSEKDIYDECHAIASDLAKCCEMYLKALYIFENNIPGNQINIIWDKLKNSEFKTDDKGNLIYLNSSGDITFVKYDDDGNSIKDNNGKIIYYDKDGNTYNENTRGSKIKRNGHQLDRLIELLSNESRMLLETRLLTIPMNITENNDSVSIIDFLQDKGKLDPYNQISEEQYLGWLDQHKKTFEESRYSGQRKYDINLEFLFHLATQIKAVVQFKMNPSDKQNFVITDEELESVPKDILKGIETFHRSLLSQELVSLIANDEEVKDKLNTIFSKPYFVLPTCVSSSTFCNMLKCMDSNEIEYVSVLSYYIEWYKDFEKNEQNDPTIDIAGIFKRLKISPKYSIEIMMALKKKVFGTETKINNKNLGVVMKFLIDSKNDYNKIDYTNYKKTNNINTKLIDKKDYKENYIFDDNLINNNNKLIF